MPSINSLTPEVFEEIYEITTGLRPRRYPYGMITYDTYIRWRYAVEIEVPRRKAEGEYSDGCLLHG